MHRYWIKVVINDESKHVKFVLFYYDGMILLKKSGYKMYETQEKVSSTLII